MSIAQPVSKVFWNLCLLTKLDEQEENGGTLLIEAYTFDPGLKMHDDISIQEFKVGSRNDSGLENLSFDFDARVVGIEKVVKRHDSLNINILLESPDRITITKIRDAFRESNPDKLN